MISLKEAGDSSGSQKQKMTMKKKRKKKKKRVGSPSPILKPTLTTLGSVVLATLEGSPDPLLSVERRFKDTTVMFLLTL